VRFVSEQGTAAKVRPDMRIVFIREFESMKQRLASTRRILRALVGIAEKAKAA
jgi:transcription-repair coupling factor (superfamily II helicase)